MQWSDLKEPPKRHTLRQFAALWLLFFGSLAGSRLWHGRMDAQAGMLAILAVLVGAAGLIKPHLMRWIYTVWMTAAFPIGWVVARAMLAILFYAGLTPLAVVFRLMGRDALRLRRVRAGSY